MGITQQILQEKKTAAGVLPAASGMSITRQILAGADQTKAGAAQSVTRQIMAEKQAVT